MTKVTKRLEQYELEDGFFCDIVYDKDSFEAWLWHKRCGVKEQMIGLDRNLSPDTKAEFISTIMTIWKGFAYDYIKNNNRDWNLGLYWIRQEEA